MPLMQLVRRASATLVLVLAAAALAASAACDNPTGGVNVPPPTAVRLRAESLFRSVGCGPGPDEVWKYVAAIRYDDGALPCTDERDCRAVYDCFADATFMNFVDPRDGRGVRIDVKAFSRASFETQAAQADAAGGAPAAEGFAPTYATTCDGAVRTNVQSVATCAPLATSPAEARLRVASLAFDTAPDAGAPDGGSGDAGADGGTEGGAGDGGGAGDAGPDAGDAGGGDAGTDASDAGASDAAADDAGTPVCSAGRVCCGVDFDTFRVRATSDAPGAPVLELAPRACGEAVDLGAAVAPSTYTLDLELQRTRDAARWAVRCSAAAAPGVATLVPPPRPHAFAACGPAVRP